MLTIIDKLLPEKVSASTKVEGKKPITPEFYQSDKLPPVKAPESTVVEGKKPQAPDLKPVKLKKPPLSKLEKKILKSKDLISLDKQNELKESCHKIKLLSNECQALLNQHRFLNGLSPIKSKIDQSVSIIEKLSSLKKTLSKHVVPSKIKSKLGKDKEVSSLVKVVVTENTSVDE
jgi:hypothetical protein